MSSLLQTPLPRSRWYNLPKSLSQAFFESIEHMWPGCLSWPIVTGGNVTHCAVSALYPNADASSEFDANQQMAPSLNAAPPRLGPLFIIGASFGFVQVCLPRSYPTNTLTLYESG